MNWQRVPLERNLGSYCAVWDELNARYYGGHPFLDSRFMAGLLKYFGTGKEQLFIHRGKDEIDGLIILRPHRFGIWQLFVPDQLQAAPVLVPNVELINELFSALPITAWSIELLNQDPEFAPMSMMANGASSFVLPHALTMNISLEGDFDAYWNTRSHNLQKNIRRYLRRAIEEQGSVQFRVLTDPEALVEGVSRYGKLESTGWKGESGTAVNIENAQGAFYAELMSGFAMTGQAHILEYKLGENLVASRLEINGGGMSIILKTTYDEKFSRFAPGRLLLHRLLESAFKEKRQKTVEFYTNATQDQLAWATGQRVISHVTVFRWHWQAVLYKTYQKVKALYRARVEGPGGARGSPSADRPD